MGDQNGIVRVDLYKKTSGNLAYSLHLTPPVEAKTASKRVALSSFALVHNIDEKLVFQFVASELEVIDLTSISTCCFDDESSLSHSRGERKEQVQRETESEEVASAVVIDAATTEAARQPFLARSHSFLSEGEGEGEDAMLTSGLNDTAYLSYMFLPKARRVLATSRKGIDLIDYKGNIVARLQDEVCVERAASDSRIFRTFDDRFLLTFGRSYDSPLSATSQLNLVDTVSGEVVSCLSQRDLAAEMEELERKNQALEEEREGGHGRSEEEEEEREIEDRRGRTAFQLSVSRLGVSALRWVSALTLDEEGQRVFLGSLDGRIFKFGTKPT